MAVLEGLTSFHRQPIDRLRNDEAQKLSELADQIAGWRDFHALDEGARTRFIMTTCQASLPHFLMRLLSSEYVTGRYREEFSKLNLSERERSAIILALYVAHIGENAPVSFLSNAMEIDFGGIIDGMSLRTRNETFYIVQREGGMIKTVPSIGAENILRNLFSDEQIVDAIVPLLKNLARIYRDPFEQRMFNQIMRFSVLSDVVTENPEIERFFEQNKQELNIRRMPLFWLQWHMAKCQTGELVDAEKLLEQGYTEAAEFERRTGRKFDRRQLDDRRAKFLMLRVRQTNRSGPEMFRDFKEANELTHKIMRQDEPQHYPFETLLDVASTFEAHNYRLSNSHKALVLDWLIQLHSYSSKRVGVLTEGYQKTRAKKSLTATKEIIGDLGT